jgi:hypothetical protein
MLNRLDQVIPSGTKVGSVAVHVVPQVMWALGENADGQSGLRAMSPWTLLHEPSRMRRYYIWVLLLAFHDLAVVAVVPCFDAPWSLWRAAQ